MQALIETWKIQQQVNELLLKSIDEGSLADIAATKGRSVGEQLAHIHNVRLMWLNVAAPELWQEQVKIEKGQPITKKLLLNSLQKSADGIAGLLQIGIETGKIKGFKPHPTAFLGYIIAHEAHHRGQVILTLKQNGHLPDKSTLMQLWEWGNKI